MNERLRNMTSVFLLHESEILLLFKPKGRVVSNVWIASAGGHFEEDELNDPEKCVLRELNEELSLHPDDLDGLALRYITLRRVHGEIRQNYFYFARLLSKENRILRSTEGNCQWFSLDKALSLDLSYAARGVLEHYISTGCHTQDIYCGAANGSRMVFTPLPESNTSESASVSQHV